MRWRVEIWMPLPIDAQLIRKNRKNFLKNFNYGIVICHKIWYDNKCHILLNIIKLLSGFAFAKNARFDCRYLIVINRE